MPTFQSVTLLTPVKGGYNEYLSLKKGKTNGLGLSNSGVNAACFNYAEHSGNMARATLSQDFSIENK